MYYLVQCKLLCDIRLKLESLSRRMLLKLGGYNLRCMDDPLFCVNRLLHCSFLGKEN